MGKFKYVAIDMKNNKVRATIEARSENEVKKQVKAKGLILLEVKEVGQSTLSYKFKASELAEFSRQLADMLSSGITVVRALEILKNRDFKPQLLKAYEKLYENVSKGITLSDAMRMEGRTFPELLINMYASGEASGQLENCATKMGNHYEKENILNGKIKSASMYPMILGVLCVAVIIIIFVFVLPNFFAIFDTMDATLPPITVFMIGFSDALSEMWHIYAIVGAAIIFFLSKIAKIPSIKLQIDKIKLRTPKLGKLLKIIYTARFSRTLASLYSSGLSMISAIEISSTTVGNSYITSQFKDVISSVRNGMNLSESVGLVEGFDKKLPSVIYIGEESGRLDSMLESVAESYDFEAQNATEKIVQLIQPIMLVIMAGLILVVMMSVMLPLLSLYQNIG